MIISGINVLKVLKIDYKTRKKMENIDLVLLKQILGYTREVYRVLSDLRRSKKTLTQDQMISAYSPKSSGCKTFSVHTNTKMFCFQIIPLWRDFSKSSVFADLFMQIQALQCGRKA